MDFLADTSYKQSQAEVIGQLTAAPVATGSQLVGYSGFSNEAFVREPYSADLDFGTGEWSASAWVNVPAVVSLGNIFKYSTNIGNAGWAKLSGLTVSSTRTTAPDGSLTAEVVTFTNQYSQFGQSNLLKKSTVYTLSFWARRISGSNSLIIIDSSTDLYGTFNPTSVWQKFTFTFTSVGWSSGGLRISDPNSSNRGDIEFWQPQLELGSVATQFKETTASGSIGYTLDRSYTSQPSVSVGVDPNGFILALSNDGTTTRTVTTPASYNTGSWLKLDAYYRTDGSLSIAVNGQQVATTGAQTPLLTLNNSNAVLTIGNNYGTNGQPNAPFPGSIALLKLSATVPTTEQLQWTYEQEKALFSANALCALPDASTVSDLTFDDKTNRLIAVSSANESYWSGLTRVYTEAVTSGGSLGKVVSTSNVHLVSRSTVNPGVDVTLPAYNIKAHLESDRTEATIKPVVVFDFDPVDNSQTAFVLPIGYSAVAVYKAGTELRETITSAKDWSRSFDGFKETITLTTAPGTTNWIQIHAVKE